MKNIEQRRNTKFTTNGDQSTKSIEKYRKILKKYIKQKLLLTGIRQLKDSKNIKKINKTKNTKYFISSNHTTNSKET